MADIMKIKGVLTYVYRKLELRAVICVTFNKFSLIVIIH